MCPPRHVGPQFCMWWPTGPTGSGLCLPLPLITPSKRPYASSLLSDKSGLPQGLCSFHFLKNYWFLINQISDQRPSGQGALLWPYTPKSSHLYHISHFVSVTPALNSLICFLKYLSAQSPSRI